MRAKVERELSAVGGRRCPRPLSSLLLLLIPLQVADDNSISNIVRLHYGEFNDFDFAAASPYSSTALEQGDQVIGKV